jgi:hypothetical protein
VNFRLQAAFPKGHWLSHFGGVAEAAPLFFAILKIEVEYTVPVSPEGRRALLRTTGEPKRNYIRQTLRDLGEVGRDERIFEGKQRIEAGKSEEQSKG